MIDVEKGPSSLWAVLPLGLRSPGSGVECRLSKPVSSILPWLLLQFLTLNSGPYFPRQCTTRCKMERALSPSNWIWLQCYMATETLSHLFKISTVSRGWCKTLMYGWPLKWSLWGVIKHKNVFRRCNKRKAELKNVSCEYYHLVKRGDLKQL